MPRTSPPSVTRDSIPACAFREESIIEATAPAPLGSRRSECRATLPAAFEALGPLADDVGKSGVLRLHMAPRYGRTAIVDPLTAGIAVVTLVLLWRTKINNAWYIAAGDFRRPGIKDLVIGNGFFATLSFLPGNGDGTFGSSRTIFSDPEQDSVTAVAVGDFNQDGALDIVVVTGMTFDHRAALDVGMASPEMRAAGRNLREIAPDMLTLVALGDDDDEAAAA